MIAITEDGYIQLPPKKPFGKLPSFKKPKLSRCLRHICQNPCRLNAKIFGTRVGIEIYYSKCQILYIHITEMGYIAL